MKINDDEINSLLVLKKVNMKKKYLFIFHRIALLKMTICTTYEYFSIVNQSGVAELFLVWVGKPLIHFFGEKVTFYV